MFIRNFSSRIPTGSMVLLIDANGEVGEYTSADIGNAFPATENANRTAFRCLVDEYGLCALNTFSGGAPSWHGSSRNGKRIDYCSISFRSIASLRRDHTPVLFDLRAAANSIESADDGPSGGKIKNARPLRINRAALNCHERRKLFSDCM